MWPLHVGKPCRRSCCEQLDECGGRDYADVVGGSEVFVGQTQSRVREISHLRWQIHIKCRVVINYWGDVEGVDNLLAPRGAVPLPAYPDAWNESSKTSRDSAVNHTVIPAADQVVQSLCDTFETSCEPLLPTFLWNLHPHAPSVCWPFEHIIRWAWTQQAPSYSPSLLIVFLLPSFRQSCHKGSRSCGAPTWRDSSRMKMRWIHSFT